MTQRKKYFTASHSERDIKEFEKMKQDFNCAKSVDENVWQTQKQSGHATQIQSKSIQNLNTAKLLINKDYKVVCFDFFFFCLKFASKRDKL